MKPQAIKRLPTEFFNMVVDTTFDSLKESFQTLAEIRDKFGVLLLNFIRLAGEALSKQCH